MNCLSGVLFSSEAFLRGCGDVAGNGLKVLKGPSRSWPALETEAVLWGEPSTSH